MEIKRDFIFDPNLVLYLPLYKLGGASFQSKDAYGHLCTVTGALLYPERGRYFDGIDDKIIVPLSGIASMATGTFIVWLMPTALQAQYDNYVGWQESGNTFLWWNEVASDNDIRIYCGGQAGFRQSINTDEWKQLGLAWESDGAWYIIEDGVRTLQGGTATVPLVLGHDLYLGSNVTGSANTYVAFGDVWLYNRALTPLEIQHNYLATKWRYK